MTPIEMMLQIRMGHISSPPFWRYSITAHLLVPFGPGRKLGRPGRHPGLTNPRTKVHDGHKGPTPVSLSRRKQRERRLLIFLPAADPLFPSLPSVSVLL